jgi:hypothetical protein
VAEVIVELGQKVKGALDALLASERQSNRVLTLCNNGRKLAERKLQQRVIAETLGMSHLSNWVSNSAKGVLQGAFLDLAALLGIAPTEAALAAFEEGYTKTHNLPPFPNRVFQMLDAWRDDSAGCLCWTAFVGSPTRLLELRLPSKPNRRGTSAELFLEIYEEKLDQLEPRLFQTVHTSADPPPLVEHRHHRYPLLFHSPQELKPAAALAEVARADADPAALLETPLPESWIDSATGKPLLDEGLPEVGDSEAEIEAKAELYGGQLEGGFTARHAVALGHAFDRESVAELREKIDSVTVPCSSFTLTAARGAGLSLALAQLVRDLEADSKTTTKVLSVIGDPARTSRLIEALDEIKAADLAAWAASFGKQLQRVMIIIDDVSGASPAGYWPLIHFRNRCRVVFTSLAGPRLAFVFGSFGAARTLHENGSRMKVALRLTKADRAACYETMAVRKPEIIKGHEGGLDGLLLAHPEEARQHDNDAQALIDFFLQHGNRKHVSSRNWLARVDDHDERQKATLALAASAQILGLPIPDRIAPKLFSEISGLGFASVEDVVRSSDRLAVTLEAWHGERPWRGVALSCPRRARSILQRTGRLEFGYLSDMLHLLIEAALNDFDAYGEEAASTLDFARHLFQRLGKKDLWEFELRSEISRKLIAEFINRITALSRRWDPGEKARWAGTVSSWLVPGSGLTQRPRPEAFPGQKACALFVGTNAKECLIEVTQGTADFAPEMALGLLRASRLLIRSGFYVEGARDVARHLDYAVSRHRLRALLEDQVKRTDEKLPYRANELVHAYCQFEADLYSIDGTERRSWWRARERCFAMSAMLDELAEFLNSQSIPLDAGTWLERSRYIWIGRESENQRVVALEKRNDYLDRADDYISYNPLTQATWRKHVLNERRRIAARFGSISVHQEQRVEA